MLETTRKWLTGAAVGAGAMYFLDPDRGNRRRAHLRDKAAHARSRVDRAAGVTSRDLRHRAIGLAARARSRLRRDQADDETVRDRVRAELGRLTSHPGAIEVSVHEGRVTLSGPILEHEIERLISGVCSVRGVKSLENRLEPHREPGDVPSLQGGRPRPGQRSEFRQENWAPATRFVAGTVGAGLVTSALRRRGPLGLGLGLAGGALLLRSLTNLPFKRLTGIGAGRKAVIIRKDLNVDAPVEEVFAFLEDVENFPRFMSHVKEVRRRENGRTHWVVEARGGIDVEWDAETTIYVPNEVIGWRSVNGSPVENAGWVRFQPNEKGGTRVTIQMSYNPPLGALGHAVAHALGTDARALIDEDLVRFKSLIEEGKTSVDGKTVTRGDLSAGRVLGRAA